MVRLIKLLPKYRDEHLLNLLIIRCLWRVDNNRIIDYHYRLDLVLMAVSVDNWDWGHKPTIIVENHLRFLILVILLFILFTD